MSVACHSAYFTDEERILSTDLVLRAVLSPVENAAPGSGANRCDARGRNLSPGRRSGSPPPLRCRGRGPRGGGLSGSPGSLSLRPRSAPDPKVPHALPLRLTVRSRRTASRRTGKPRVRHSRPGSGTHAPWRRRWRSPEGLRGPGKGKPDPNQAADISQSAGVPPASASPPTLWAVRSRSRRGLWVS